MAGRVVLHRLGLSRAGSCAEGQRGECQLSRGVGGPRPPTPGLPDHVSYLAEELGAFDGELWPRKLDNRKYVPSTQWCVTRLERAQRPSAPSGVCPGLGIQCKHLGMAAEALWVRGQSCSGSMSGGGASQSTQMRREQRAFQREHRQARQREPSVAT